MSIWFQEEKKPRKRPEWIGPATWKRTTGVFTCRLAQDIQTRLHPLLAAKIKSNVDGKLQRLESGGAGDV